MTATQEPAELDPFEDLLDVLDLKTVGAAHISVDSPGDDESDLGDSEADIFVGRSQPMPHGRVFGGQVLAQSIIAAGRTVEDVDGEPRHIHSLHGYFLRPGDTSHPIRFAVERLRDGRSFSARRVHAIQYGKPILSMITSFQTAGRRARPPGLDARVPGPRAAAHHGAGARRLRRRHLGLLVDPAVDRPAARRGGDLRRPGRQRAAQQSVWLKAASRLPDDPLLHAAVLAYSSDYPARAGAAQARAGLGRPPVAPRQPRPRDVVPPPRPRGRVDALHAGLAVRLRRAGAGDRTDVAADGTLVASVAQEGMLRVKDS